jgi:hypothetical protein
VVHWGRGGGCGLLWVGTMAGQSQGKAWRWELAAEREQDGCSGFLKGD